MYRRLQFVSAQGGLRTRTVVNTSISISTSIFMLSKEQVVGEASQSGNSRLSTKISHETRVPYSVTDSLLP